MIKFRNILIKEEMARGCFNIGREQMPQINEIEEFKSYLKFNGVNFIEKSFATRTIKPTQIEYDEEKVKNMDLIKDKPIVISSDLMVLDGHHRYFKHIEEDEKMIFAIKVDLPINELLITCNNFNNK